MDAPRTPLTKPLPEDISGDEADGGSDIAIDAVHFLWRLVVVGKTRGAPVHMNNESNLILLSRRGRL
jgi:hypothetical protein